MLATTGGDIGKQRVCGESVESVWLFHSQRKLLQCDGPDFRAYWPSLHLSLGSFLFLGEFPGPGGNIGKRRVCGESAESPQRVFGYFPLSEYGIIQLFQTSEHIGLDCISFSFLSLSLGVPWIPSASNIYRLPPLPPSSKTR